MKALFLLFSLMGFTPVYGSGAEDLTSFRNSCSPSEVWSFSENFTKENPELRERFGRFLKGQLQPMEGFAQALALRQYGVSEEARLFGEYWISRALFDAQLYHSAMNGFAILSARPADEATAAVILAALECQLRAMARFPALSSLALTSPRLGELHRLLTTHPSLKSMLPVIHEAATERIISEVSRPKLSADYFESTLALLSGAGSYDNLARGLVAARFSRHAEATQALEKFSSASAIPRPLARYMDQAHLLTARALYSLKRFSAAAEHLKQVKKSSNELVDTLSELSWAQLLDFKYGEAIGTALSLQAGSLRRTFAPESPMVMAMAMNELCQYPDSIRSIRIFNRHYEPSHSWLTAWQANGGESRPLYPLAIDYLKKTLKGVPDKIASEWIRSALFIANQDEINLLVDEQETVRDLNRNTSALQNKMANEILLQIKELKPRFKLAKMKQKENELLSRGILDELSQLKSRIVDLRRLQRSAPVWAKIAAAQSARAGVRKDTLISIINRHLMERTQRMLLQLGEIAENIQLIEVEIYNGATHDIIWQSAHPDYKKLAQKMSDDGASSENRAPSWNWGRMPASIDEEGEIWEDELGSFKANLYDNCTSKDRYLALKRGNSP